jgi:hypothetical protein
VRRLLALSAASLVLAPHPAWAQEAPGSVLPPAVNARANDVAIDPRGRELVLKGDVRVDSPPFYLTSDALTVTRTRYGADVQGRGKVAFCPCLGGASRSEAPWLAVGFDEATVAPPADLFVHDPTLRVFDVPILWLPWFWLRSPGRIGLLPPDAQYRGKDGLLLGDGVHLPWRPGDAEHGIDLRAAAYTVGGAAVDVRSVTASTTTRARWDRLHGDDGFTLDARGAIEPVESGTLAWDVDAIRGARGVASTTELDAAARAYDRATAETAWRAGPLTLASGVRAASVRGGAPLELGAAGPTVTARVSESLGDVGAFDATVDGGQLRGDGLRALSYARAETGTLAALRLGAVGASLDARAAGDLADDGLTRGKDGAASARGELALPFVRAYELGDTRDPVRHRLEPRIAAGALAAHDEGVLGVVPGRGAALVHGAAWFAQGTLYNALGRWGARAGTELEASLGAIGDDAHARPVFRWRGATTTRWIGTAAEVARVLSGTGGAGGPGMAAVTRYRLGRTDGLHVGALLATRTGVDPVAARVLTDAPLEPRGGFLAREGWTGGARLALPWTRGVLTTAGADADLSAPELLAARGAIELRDRCGCLVVRVAGAHRLGRPGVDVGLTIDLVQPAP